MSAFKAYFCVIYCECNPYTTNTKRLASFKKREGGKKNQALGSNKTFWTEWYLVCTHACLAEHLQSPGYPAAAVEHFFPCVQVFGDYYHFRHHAVEKRALSGHRGMHVRLHKEPQVRAVSASPSTLQLAAAKIQKTDCIREKNVNITTEREKNSVIDSLSSCGRFCKHTCLIFPPQRHLSCHLPAYMQTE